MAIIEPNSSFFVSREPDTRTMLFLVALYLIGLVAYKYPPVWIPVTRSLTLRPDWILSIPLIVYLTWTKRSVVLTPAAILFFVFFCVALVSGIVNRSYLTETFLTVTVQLSYVIGLFSILSSLEFSTDRFRTILRFWLLLVVVVTVYGIYQAIGLNTAVPLFAFRDAELIAAPYNEYLRPKSIFSEPAVFSGIILSGIALLGQATVSREPTFFSTKWQRIALAVLLLGLLLSGSFSGYLAAIIASVVLLHRSDFRAPILGSALLGAIGLTVAFIAADMGVDIAIMITTRFSALVGLITTGSAAGGGSITIRAARTIVGFQAWLDNPALGISPGMLDSWVQSTPESQLPKAGKSLASLHGVWIHVLTFTGAIGLVLFVGGWIAVVQEFLCRLSEPPRRDRVLLQSCYVLVVVLLVMWSFNHSFVHTPTWALLGLVYGFAISKRRHDE